MRRTNDNGTKTVIVAINHASDGPIVDQFTAPAPAVESPANARNALMNCEIGWLRTTGWIHSGNLSAG